MINIINTETILKQTYLKQQSTTKASLSPPAVKEKAACLCTSNL